MYAAKIKLKDNAGKTNNPKDIAGIYLSDGKKLIYFTVENLYDYLISNPLDLIAVGENTGSHLVPTRATNGKKYIRSAPNRGMIDLLMQLPRE